MKAYPLMMPSTILENFDSQSARYLLMTAEEMAKNPNDDFKTSRFKSMATIFSAHVMPLKACG
ncbi:hypothetical protein Ciccas_013523 [Cichlidogyrus casuarinus]|uniref:Uncharacterized protein n=1 Tax=Cichlidogyrus casuarinus TaxID=1844966 RepID=A0ABD2PKC4_9PLAT